MGALFRSNGHSAGVGHPLLVLVCSAVLLHSPCTRSLSFHNSPDSRYTLLCQSKLLDLVGHWEGQGRGFPHNLNENGQIFTPKFVLLIFVWLKVPPCIASSLFLVWHFLFDFGPTTTSSPIPFSFVHPLPIRPPPPRTRCPPAPFYSTYAAPTPPVRGPFPSRLLFRVGELPPRGAGMGGSGRIPPPRGGCPVPFGSPKRPGIFLPPFLADFLDPYFGVPRDPTPGGGEYPTPLG